MANSGAMADTRKNAQTRPLDNGPSGEPAAPQPALLALARLLGRQAARGDWAACHADDADVAVKEAEG